MLALLSAIVMVVGIVILAMNSLIGVAFLIVGFTGLIYTSLMQKVKRVDEEEKSLENCLEKLKDNSRRIFELHYDGLTESEICKKIETETGIPAEVVDEFYKQKIEQFLKDDKEPDTSSEDLGKLKEKVS